MENLDELFSSPPFSLCVLPLFRKISVQKFKPGGVPSSLTVYGSVLGHCIGSSDKSEVVHTYRLHVKSGRKKMPPRPKKKTPFFQTGGDVALLSPPPSVESVQGECFDVRSVQKKTKCVLLGSTMTCVSAFPFERAWPWLINTRLQPVQYVLAASTLDPSSSTLFRRNLSGRSCHPSPPPPPGF